MIGHLRSGLAALPIVLLSLALLSGAFSLQAKDLPSDLCALLPGTQSGKVLQETFGTNTPVTSVGDAAYRDSNYALHILKGKVRYYINIIPIGTYTPEKEKQLRDLATWVAGQL